MPEFMVAGMEYKRLFDQSRAIEHYAIKLDKGKSHWKGSSGSNPADGHRRIQPRRRSCQGLKTRRTLIIAMCM